MTPDELRESWARTTAFLLNARSNISEPGEGICKSQIVEFESCLEHNELELALDMLDAVVADSEFETPHMLELMAKAALCMGLADRVKEYDKRLTQWRGWEYHTKVE